MVSVFNSCRSVTCKWVLYARVQSLIERMYKDGGNAKVTIVAHSLGGPVSLYFLNNVVNQQWKDTYINAFIPIAGAWSGGNVALEAVISGYQHSNLFSLMAEFCRYSPPMQFTTSIEERYSHITKCFDAPS